MNKVYIVGLPASGKTTIGRWLSEKMNWSFLDIDEKIVQDQGMSIFDYFKIHGEESFRLLETKILRETETLSHYVIACGGGTASHSDNMMWISAQGLTLFLNPDLGTIQTRIVENPNHSPIFEDKSITQIREMLHELLEKRGSDYHKSKIIWNKSKPEKTLHIAINQLVM